MIFKFKKDQTISGEDFWYDLTDGGYIKPEELLEDKEQIKKVREAITIITEFEGQMIDSGIMEVWQIIVDEYVENTAPNYDPGINNDSFAVWRNDGDIGYVHIAMKVISEAMYDLLLGDYDNMMSAYYFFFGEMTDEELSDKDSIMPIWNRVMNKPDYELPVIVERSTGEYVDQDDLEYVRNLCTVVKTI